MSYTTDLIKQRRQLIDTGSSGVQVSGASPKPSSYTQQIIQQRRQAINTNQNNGVNVLPPLIAKPQVTEQPKPERKNIIDKTKGFLQDFGEKRQQGTDIFSKGGQLIKKASDWAFGSDQQILETQKADLSNKLITKKQENKNTSEEELQLSMIEKIENNSIDDGTKQQFMQYIRLSRYGQQIQASAGHLLSGLLGVSRQNEEAEAPRQAEFYRKLYERDKDKPIAEYYKKEMEYYEAVSNGTGKTRAEEAIDKINKWSDEVDVQYPTPSEKVANAGGSMAVFTVASVVSGGSASVPLVLESLGEAGSVYNENRDQGKDIKYSGDRANVTMVANLIVGKFLNIFDDIGADKGIKAVIKGIGTEGGQEGTQQIISNLATDRPVEEGLVESVVIGGLLGGGTVLVFPNVQETKGIPTDPDIFINEMISTDFAKTSQGKQLIKTALDAKNRGKALLVNFNGENVSISISNDAFRPPSVDENLVEQEDQKDQEKTLIQERQGQEPIFDNELDQKQYDEFLKDKYETAQASRQGNEVTVIQTGDGNYVDTIPEVAINRGANENTKVFNVEENLLETTGDVAKDERGERLLDEAKIKEIVNQTIQETKTQESAKEEFDYSSTQLDLPVEVAQEIKDFGKKIPDTELVKDPTANYDAQKTGLETDPHITVLYGLDTTNEADVRSIVESSGPIEVTLGDVSIFENEDYDVVKVGVEGEALNALNKQLDEALKTPGKTFDEYQPHVTIAYVQKGQGAKYVGDTTFKGQKITLNELTFSSKDGSKTNIKLLGKDQKVSDQKATQESKPKNKTATKKTQSKVANKNAVKSDTRLRDYYLNQDQEAVGQAWYEVMSELEVAEAGSRLYDENGNVVGGLSSTFPDWVPSELRLRSLFDSVLKDISDPTNMTFPPNSQPRKQALYEEILSMIDSRAGTDSSDIIEEIKNGKKETKAKESTKTSDRSSTGSKSSEEEIVLSQTINKKKTKDTYNETLNLQDKDDLEYIERVFAPYQIEEFQKGNFGNRTKEEVEKILRANLINEKPKTLSEKLEGRVKEYKLDDKTLYHGTTADNTQIILDEGFIPSTELSEDSFRGGGHGASQGSISFSTDPRIASNFTGSSPRGVVFEVTLNKKAKVVTIEDIDYAEDFNDFIPLLREQGIDAVYLAGEKEVAVINNDLIEIKSHKEFTVSDKNQRNNLYSKPIQKKVTGPTVDSVKSGLQTKGAEKIDNFELRKPPKKNTDEFKLYKKIEGLIRKYASTVGEGYTPRGALGVYFNKTKNIRVNSMNDLSVASHEIAHYLDFANKITENLTEKSKVTKELADLYVEHYPGARPNHKNRLKMLEGYATLLQKYTEMPSTIEAKYPNLVKEMLMPGGKYYHKVIGDILTDLNSIVADYQELSSLDKIGAKITSENVNIDKGSFLNFWQKLRTQIADKVYPVEVLAEKTGRVGTKEDPSLWVRAYNSVSGIIDNNISTDRGYWAFTNLQEGFQKKYDYNWKTLVESVSNRGNIDDFASYLVARREHYYYQELDTLAGELENQKRIYDEVKNIKSTKFREDENYRNEYRDIISELDDFGIDMETDPDVIKSSMKKALENAQKKHDDLKKILDNDGFSREEVDQAYEEHKDRFKDEEEMFDTLSNEDLNMLHNEDVQLIDKKTYNRLKGKDGYASFKRQFYDEIVGDAEGTVGSVGVGGVKVSSLISRKGSSRTIINPLYSALANHSEVTRKAMKQVVYNQMGSLGKSGLLPTLFQEVQLKAVPDGQGRIIFPQEKDNNIIMARENYKRKPILTDKTVKQTIDNLLSYKNIDVFTQLYTGLTRTFTAGTTGLYPAFAITNFVVDQITATANSYNKYKALYSPMKEMLNVMRNKNSVEAKYYEEYLVMGGERQTFTGWQKVQPKDLFKKIAGEKKNMQKAIDALNKGVDILSIPSAKSEIFSRATEYINARKAGKSQIVALEEAGRVTAPFHHIGAWGGDFFSTYIRGLPFFNASIQVLDQTTRVASTKSGRQRMAFVTMAVTSAYLSAILAMLDASDEQKEQYKDLEPEDLTNFVYFPNPNGKDLIRVKMSNLFSVPGATMNMIIANKMFSANYTARDIAESATSFLPTQFQITEPKNILSWLPQVFKPTAYTVLNVKDYPKVSSLVPMTLSRLPERYQYNEGTSTFAKKLGELMNVSPIKVDYLLTGYFGRASGFLTGKPGVYNPGSTIFRSHYFTMGRNVRQFYETKEENDGEYSAYQNWKPGTETYDKERVSEIYRVKIITDDMNDILSEYRKIDPEKDIERASELRTKFYFLKEKLDDGTKPKNFSKWANDADKRRSKNKSK